MPPAKTPQSILPEERSRGFGRLADDALKMAFAGQMFGGLDLTGLIAILFI